ncbi:MAG: hypothetical protein AAFR11_05700 [Pseudomonadota bacterium]
MKHEYGFWAVINQDAPESGQYLVAMVTGGTGTWGPQDEARQLNTMADAVSLIDQLDGAVRHHCSPRFVTQKEMAA